MTRSWLRAPIGTMTACVAVVLAASALAAPAGAGRPGAAVPKGPPPPYTLAFQLTCVPKMPLPSVITYVALVNNGPGTVPAGTKVHWNLNMQPGPDRSGDYTFTSALAVGDHVWMQGALPITFKDGPCTVTVLK